MELDRSHRRDPSKDGSVVDQDQEGFPLVPRSSPRPPRPITTSISTPTLIEDLPLDNNPADSDSVTSDGELDELLEDGNGILTSILQGIENENSKQQNGETRARPISDAVATSDNLHILKEFNYEESMRATMLQNRRRVASQIVKRITRSKQSNKRIALVNMGLAAEDLPIKELLRLNRGKSMIQQYLRILLLGGNSIDSLPIPLVEEMKGLVELDLSQNDLQELPQKVKWNLVSLATLDLSHNSLQSFLNVRAMKHLKNLRVLNLSNNHMTEFSLPAPAALRHSSSSSSSLSMAQYPVLPNLQELNLGFNQLKDLPPQLTTWTKLRILQVNNNLLEYIPPRVVLGLRNLDVLDCRNNPLIQPPAVDAERGLDVMRRYYTALLGREYDLSLLGEDLKGESDEESASKCASVTRLSKTKHLKQKARRALSEGIKAGPKKIEAKLDRRSTGGSSTKSEKLKKLKDIGAKAFPKPRHIIVSREREVSQASSDAERKEQAHPLRDASETSLGGSLTDSRKGSFYPIGPDLLRPEMRGPTIEVTMNDTLKIVCVGAPGSGKTSMMQNLMEGKPSPSEDESDSEEASPDGENSLFSVEHFDWDPKMKLEEGVYDAANEEIDESDGTAHPFSTTIPRDLVVESEENLGGAALVLRDEENHIKFSVWVCGGIEGGHCIHELVFSPRALYIVTWDMGAKDSKTFPPAKGRRPRHKKKRKTSKFDSSDDESTASGPITDGIDENYQQSSSSPQQQAADNALMENIERHVQFWVDSIQTIVPGAIILPVGTFADKLDIQEQHRRWNMLRKVIEERENRQLKHMEQNYNELTQTKQANLPQADKLRRLLDPSARPKFVWLEQPYPSESPRSTRNLATPLCVSSAEYNGFEALRKCIIQLALGELPNQAFFHGHVGAILPPIRQKVNDVIVQRRRKLKVVETRHFLNMIRDTEGIVPNCDEEVLDSLYFLSSVGEISYFYDNVPPQTNEHHHALSLDNRTPSNYDVPCIGIDDVTGIVTRRNISSNVSSYFFLNPKLLFAAAGSIVHPNIEKDIASIAANRMREYTDVTAQKANIVQTTLNAPILTGSEASLLWKANRRLKEAGENCASVVFSTSSRSVFFFQFLNRLFEAFQIFVSLGTATEIIRLNRSRLELPNDASCLDELSRATMRKVFMIPSLILDDKPEGEVWTFKSQDSYKSTLAVTWLLRDSGSTSHLMEGVVASIFSILSSSSSSSNNNNNVSTNGVAERQDVNIFHSSSEHPVKDAFRYEEIVGSLCIESVSLWRTALLFQFSTMYAPPGGVGNGKGKKSFVDVFVCLVDQDDPLHCVGCEFIPRGTKKLVASARGQNGLVGWKIWSGGFGLVTKAIERAFTEMPGISASKEAVCCDCLQRSSLSRVRSWQWDHLQLMLRDGRKQVFCTEGHLVDVQLLCGGLKRCKPIVTPEQSKSRIEDEASAILEFRSAVPALTNPVKPVKDLIKSVVLVALWDSKKKSMLRVGSGFVVDSKYGLIVTAGHTLFDMTTSKVGQLRNGTTSGSKFGQKYFGHSECKIVIGTISDEQLNQSAALASETSLWEAKYRFFADIVQDDVENVDACVLKLTSRFEKDVEESKKDFSGIAEIILKRKKEDYKGLGYPVEDFAEQNLKSLELATHAVAEEEIRLLGYNQGGEGIYSPGSYVNRAIDFSKGYFVRTFTPPNTERDPVATKQFFPRQEFIVKCPTVGGHSGGPCVNNDGKVIGILSRVDPADPRICYIVPFAEFKKMVSKARAASKREVPYSFF